MVILSVLTSPPAPPFAKPAKYVGRQSLITNRAVRSAGHYFLSTLLWIAGNSRFVCRQDQRVACDRESTVFRSVDRIVGPCFL